MLVVSEVCFQGYRISSPLSFRLENDYETHLQTKPREGTEKGTCFRVGG